MNKYNSRVGLYRVRALRPGSYDALRARCVAICPGCVIDPDQRKHRLSRWLKLPQKAYLVYWRSHPEKLARLKQLKGAT